MYSLSPKGNIKLKTTKKTKHWQKSYRYANFIYLFIYNIFMTSVGTEFLMTSSQDTGTLVSAHKAHSCVQVLVHPKNPASAAMSLHNRAVCSELLLLPALMVCGLTAGLKR